MVAARGLIWEHSYGSTTIDAICDRAQVKKGSFYHFFESKSDLAIEALRTDWAVKRASLEQVFSSATPPLQRFKNYFDAVYQRQAQIKKESGSVLGCPLFTLGSEISTQDAKLRSTVQDILEEYQRFFESAIRDAQAQGLIHAPNPACKTKCLFSFFQGALVQARIHNDVELLKDLYPNALELLGATEALAA